MNKKLKNSPLSLFVYKRKELSRKIAAIKKQGLYSGECEILRPTKVRKCEKEVVFCRENVKVDNI